MVTSLALERVENMDQDSDDDDVEWVKIPTHLCTFLARSECPECGTKLIVQLSPGYFTVCHKCGEVLAVFPFPLLLTETKNICMFKLCMHDGRSRDVHTPGFFEFGEWVL